MLFTRRLVTNPWIGAAAVVVIALQAVALYVPGLAAILGNVPLDLEAWMAVLLAGVTPLLVGQAWRLAKARGMVTARSA